MLIVANSSISIYWYVSVCAGTSSPPSIAATPVPALPPPLAVNSYPSVAAPPNGQSATETLYTNGVHTYQGTAVSKKLRSVSVHRSTESRFDVQQPESN